MTVNDSTHPQVKHYETIGNITKHLQKSTPLRNEKRRTPPKNPKTFIHENSFPPYRRGAIANTPRRETGVTNARQGARRDSSTGRDDRRGYRARTWSSRGAPFFSADAIVRRRFALNYVFPARLSPGPEKDLSLSVRDGAAE